MVRRFLVTNEGKAISGLGLGGSPSTLLVLMLSLEIAIAGTFEMPFGGLLNRL